MTKRVLVAGLQRLEWCSEAYRFDKGWAQEDVACRKRIAVCEVGDATALGALVLAPASLDSAQVDSTVTPTSRM